MEKDVLEFILKIIQENNNMCNDVGEKITLGGLFQEEKKIHVPILQRDYAQGRIDKGYVRERFLKDMKEAVCNDKELSMHFIYGYANEKDTVFYPLDGQQRLTTLWLVYWYLALRAGKLNDECDNLMKFSYETRKTSREFCRTICSQMGNYQLADGPVVKYMKNQTWFFETWKNDPTINSMLRTIGGTADSSADGIDIVFKEIKDGSENPVSFHVALDRLKTNIYFYKVTIGNDKMPKRSAERLYMKMNARGKGLSDFEDFKADFIDQFIKNPAFKNLEIDEEDIKVILPKEIDNKWNDLFWNSIEDETDRKTDEIYMAFLHRFCLNRWVVAKDGNGDYLVRDTLLQFISEIKDEEESGNRSAKKELEKMTDEEKKAILVYDYLSRDEMISYEKYDAYTEILNPEGVVKLHTVMNGKETFRKDL